ncbi:MAG TPA: peptidase M16, partial [Spirochaetia bacterium]|nr:peptidase M16 [Spirochaetia bacterium]
MKKSLPAPGNVISGFVVEAIHDLQEIRSRGILCRHQKTGLQLYHILNDDRENAFAFAFRTPPRDSTGIAHILEHSVLCGSRDFPLKDPFVLLLKGSLHTYLNAWTFPDKTVYPAATVNEKDYFNIFRVYGDAVFFPLLKKEIFMQEAHHLEPLDPDNEQSPLTESGVVYNEMKGNYSSQASIVADWAMRSLFPDTPYGVDSGGDPADIITLTHKELQDFHAAYYHPGNCRILLYGNIPTETQLAFLEKEFLSRFTPREVDSVIPLQPRRTAPVTMVKTYPVAPGVPLGRKTEITLNWLLAPVTDSAARTALVVLSEILHGNAGSPLRRALVESGWGEDYTSAAGLETELKEMTFTTGLRGTDPDQAKTIEKVVMDTLEGLVRDGLDQRLIDAALHRYEFHAREITGGHTPFALQLFRRCLKGWLHDADPTETLLAVSKIDALKARRKTNARLFEELIRTYLLENPHQSTVIVKPDPAYMQAFEESLQNEISARAGKIDPEARARLQEELAALKRFQTMPNDPAALASIPFLKRTDLPRHVELIDGRDESLSDRRPLFVVPEFTNGVVYVD